MDDKVCPFCGAGQKSPEHYFDCGQGYDWKVRSVHCCLSQIAQLTERLEAWREWHGTLGLIEHKYGLHKDGERTINKLKALGEI